MTKMNKTTPYSTAQNLRRFNSLNFRGLSWSRRAEWLILTVR